MKIFSVLLLAFVTFFAACVKDKPGIKEVEPSLVATLRPVFVLNEGNYSAANASLSYYNVKDQSVIEDYYRQQNNAPLGDVLQSMLKFENKYYLVVNNSNKIVVCDSTMKKINQISGLTSPRYFLPINKQKAYVSDLYANQIHIVDLNSNSKIGSIPCFGWTERMLLFNNKVFVCNNNRDYVYVVDVLLDKIIDSVLVGKHVATAVLDKNNNLWVLNGGDLDKSSKASLMKISTQSLQIVKQWQFEANQSPSNLCLNAKGDTLYYLNKGVYRVSIESDRLPEQAFIANDNRNFYGLGINPNDYTIYVSDALDYIQKSTCYVYNANGIQLSVFKAGMNAGAFYFE